MEGKGKDLMDHHSCYEHNLQRDIMAHHDLMSPPQTTTSAKEGAIPFVDGNE